MHGDLERLASELGEALKGLDAEQSQLCPKASSGKWSIQQIVEHLVMSYQRTCEVLGERVKKGQATRTKASFAQLFGQLVVIRFGHFPGGRPAPAVVTPGLPIRLLGGSELTQRIRGELGKMEDAADAAERLFGSVRCATHIILGPLAIPQWKRFHLVHGRHHLHQIRRIRKDYSV